VLDFSFAVHGEAVGEQALGQAVTADDASGSAAARGVKATTALPSLTNIPSGRIGVVTRIHEGLVSVGFGGCGGW